MATLKGLKRDFKALEARRFRAITLFDRCLSKAEVARHLGVSAQSVGRWHTAWTLQGAEALLAAERAGRRSRVTPWQRERFENFLREAAEQSGENGEPPLTLARLAVAVRDELGFEYHPAHLSRLLRQRGLTLPRQRPQDEVPVMETSSTRRRSRSYAGARI
ncbi:MAG TPA: helix-turn-helix domain-containing protein [Candidatus Limnocylindria bacterium]|jgi:transposase|nr:helix-turn-helix domain-containing protein [Candidatus Limnocylindria bacterium]